MNAWIDEIAELTGLGQATTEFSLSHLRALLPDTRLCWMAAAVMAFCFVAAWQDVWLNRRQDRNSDTHQE